jgi:hypothetical protein
MGGSHCREKSVPVDPLTRFVRTQDKEFIAYVTLGGLEADRDYAISARWLDPRGNMAQRATGTIHTPLEFPPNFYLNYRLRFTPSNPSTLELGRWRVEITVNGQVEGEHIFDVVDQEDSARYTVNHAKSSLPKLVDVGELKAKRNSTKMHRPKAHEIGRDGSFIAYDKGIVKDTKTGLEWVAGPDRNTTWYKAKSWVESLSIDGGGWRMPTREELKSLYQKGAGKRNMTPLLKTTGWFVWSGETYTYRSSAWYFSFLTGNKQRLLAWLPRDADFLSRAFAVRSRR